MTVIAYCENSVQYVSQQMASLAYKLYKIHFRPRNPLPIPYFARRLRRLAVDAFGVEPTLGAYGDSNPPIENFWLRHCVRVKTLMFNRYSIVAPQP